MCWKLMKSFDMEAHEASLRSKSVFDVHFASLLPENNQGGTTGSSTASTSTAQLFHNAISCYGCKQERITSPRYKCTVCIDYDLCAFCKDIRGVHAKHKFRKIVKIN